MAEIMVPSIIPTHRKNAALNIFIFHLHCAGCRFSHLHREAAVTPPAALLHVFLTRFGDPAGHLFLCT